MAPKCLVLLAVCALVLALAACGGSSAKLTQAQYDAKVSRLCLLAADQFREMHLLNTVGDWQHFDKALAALKPPSSIARDAAAFLGANKDALADDRFAIAAARAGDNAGLHHAIRADHGDHGAAYHSAEKIGATGCYIP